MRHFPRRAEEEDPAPDEKRQTNCHKGLTRPGGLPEPEVTAQQCTNGEQHSQHDGAAIG